MTNSQPFDVTFPAAPIKGRSRKRKVNPAGLFALEVSKVLVARGITRHPAGDRILRRRAARGSGCGGGAHRAGFGVVGRRDCPAASCGGAGPRLPRCWTGRLTWPPSTPRRHDDPVPPVKLWFHRRRAALNQRLPRTRKTSVGPAKSDCAPSGGPDRC